MHTPRHTPICESFNVYKKNIYIKKIKEGENWTGVGSSGSRSVGEVDSFSV